MISFLQDAFFITSIIIIHLLYHYHHRHHIYFVNATVQKHPKLKIFFSPINMPKHRLASSRLFTVFYTIL